MAEGQGSKDHDSRFSMDAYMAVNPPYDTQRQVRTGVIQAHSRYKRDVKVREEEREGVTPATNWQSEGVSQKSIITSVILEIRAFAKCRLGECSLAKNVNTYKGQLRYPRIFTSCTTPTETLAFLPHSTISYTVRAQGWANSFRRANCYFSLQLCNKYS